MLTPRLICNISVINIQVHNKKKRSESLIHHSPSLPIFWTPIFQSNIQSSSGLDRQVWSNSEFGRADDSANTVSCLQIRHNGFTTGVFTRQPAGMPHRSHSNSFFKRNKGREEATWKRIVTLSSFTFCLLPTLTVSSVWSTVWHIASSLPAHISLRHSVSNSCFSTCSNNNPPPFEHIYCSSTPPPPSDCSLPEHTSMLCLTPLRSAQTCLWSSTVTSYKTAGMSR